MKIPRKLKSACRLLADVFSVWSNANASTMGAAAAYYTIFAIAPLFILVLALAGLLFGHEAAQHELFGQISGLVGQKSAETIQSLLAAANRPRTGLLATILGFATLFIGATGVFMQLQDSLNAIWSVRPVGGGIRKFIMTRLISFAALLGIGFLLLVSLILSAALAAAGKWMRGFMPGSDVIWQIIDFAVSLGLITLLFAMMFKVLPDIKIGWKDVWIGAFTTAILFTIGKILIGLYLGRGSVSSAYGAAGSFVIVLLWVYYSVQILLLGAASTRIYANRFGSHVKPAEHAKFVGEQKKAA